MNSGQKCVYMPKEEKKTDFHLTCTKKKIASLKIPTPHCLSNGPSLTSYDNMQLYKGRYYFLLWTYWMLVEC